MSESKLVRYELFHCESSYMDENEDGRYVTHADYKALEERCEALQNVALWADDDRKELSEKLASLKARVAELVEADRAVDAAQKVLNCENARNESSLEAENAYDSAFARRRLALEALS